MDHERPPQEQHEQQVIHVIHKGPKQELRVSLNTFRGRTFGDLRLFILNSQGEWIPTMKGCTVGVGQLEELEEAVSKLRDASKPSSSHISRRSFAIPIALIAVAPQERCVALVKHWMVEM